jgi:hypothetical protein
MEKFITMCTGREKLLPGVLRSFKVIEGHLVLVSTTLLRRSAMQISQCIPWRNRGLPQTAFGRYG